MASGAAGSVRCLRMTVRPCKRNATAARLDGISDAYRLFRCRTIMNCTDVCPKGLSPAAAISQIRDMLVRRAI